MGGPAPRYKRPVNGPGSAPAPAITIQPAPAPPSAGNQQTLQALGLRDDPLAPVAERRAKAEQEDLTKLGDPAPGKDRTVDVGGQDTKIDLGPRNLFHVTVTAAGAKGSIESETDYTIHMDPKQRYGDVLVGPASGQTVGTAADIEGVHGPAGLAPVQSVKLYPIVLEYRRMLRLTDRDGRNVTVSVNSTVQFSYETWEAATAGRTLSLETLESLVGDEALSGATVSGFGQLIKYDLTAISEERSIAAGMAGTVARLAGSPALTDVAGLPMTFILPGETAGSQFETLGAVLRRMDQKERERRANLPVGSFSGGSAADEPSDDLPAWARSLVSALSKALLMVGGVLVGAMIIAPLFGISVGLAVLWIGASLLGASFVNALIARIQEARDEGVSNPFSVVGAAVADTVGAAAVYEAVTDQSLLSGRKLNRSEEERWEAGFTGAITFGLTVLGARSSGKPPPGKAARAEPGPEPPAAEPAPPRRAPPEDHPGMDMWTESHDPSPQVITRLRQARCTIGEQGVAFKNYPQEFGWAFIEGPSGSGGHAWNAPGFDGVAFRTRGQFRMEIIDNKAFASQGNVSSSSALTRNLLKNLDDLAAQITDPVYNDVPQIVQLRSSVDATRAAVRNNTPLPGNVSLVVTNFGGQSTGITTGLGNLGITFRNVR